MFELVIALRHITSRKRQTLFSVLAVALSVAIIIISMSMMSGFVSNIIDVTVENQAHISIEPKENEEFIYLYHALEDRLRKSEHITAVSSYYRGEAILEHREEVEGILLLGINPEDENRVMRIEEDLIEGDFDSLNRPGNHIILGFRLAQNLGAGMGDTVTAIFPGAKTTKFTVTGVSQTGTPLDESLAYAHLGQVQDFYGKSDVVTTIRIRVDDIYEADNIANIIEGETGYGAKSWMEDNSEILKLINTQTQFVYIFYILIFTISGFGIANTLINIIMEKIGEIGILLAMGANRKSIMMIFLFEAATLGTIGIIMGSIIGYVSAAALASYTIPVPPETYFGMDHLPVRIVPGNFLIAGVFSFALNILVSVFPARRASKMDPMEAIHSV